MKTNKPKFYNIIPILKLNADYNLIWGERSNGKTHAVLMLALFGCHENGINYNGYLDDGTQFAYIRRFDDDIRPKYAKSIFNGIINNQYDGNILYKKTKGKWNNILMDTGAYYLVSTDENGDVVEKDSTPFGYTFAINLAERYKGNAYPKVKTILFDEFLTRKYYLANEFIDLTSILSTIIRLRDDVKIFLCGNTINKYNPYFAEMGLNKAKTMKSGTIDIYAYGDSSLRVACQYCGDINFSKSKASNKYFAFDNPRLKMITQGKWEMSLYPHLPFKYNFYTDVRYIYFIIFDGEMLQCEIIQKDDRYITFIHRKTSNIIDDGQSLVYQVETDSRPNYRRKITRPMSKREQSIVNFFKKDKVFYQDNEVGEIVRNYLNWCNTGE